MLVYFFMLLVWVLHNHDYRSEYTLLSLFRLSGYPRPPSFTPMFRPPPLNLQRARSEIKTSTFDCGLAVTLFLKPIVIMGWVHGVYLPCTPLPDPALGSSLLSREVCPS